MEWGILEIGQLLLYIMALGLPTAWLTGWLYRKWRKANMPAILGMISRQRRRDRAIKQTRDRTSALEMWKADTEKQVEALEARAQAAEGRLGKMEQVIAQLRQKLRGRGIVIDA